MSQFRRAAAVSTLCAVLAAGCGWVSKSVKILDAAASPDGLSLELTIATCSTDLRVEVEEDAESVAVWVSSRNGMQPECSTGLMVELQEPLGGRRLIDGHDFTEVEVRADT